ncbi:Hsp70 family protein [Actinophytocola sp.]|uniref:Hsp70 family protein n=1 Tax=Actinophytocola sp. TaxID=1872138 RepID=UPI0025BDD6D4|nr:Hsp70 family protein [Actinophytocola sp.]
MSILSVDLGTSNTVAVLAAHGRPPRVVEVDGSAATPSALFAAEDGTLVVGREAERRARLEPARFEPNPKRRVDEGTLLLGDRVVPVTDAFAAVLGKVSAETVRQLGGARPDEVRLTHPAQWGPVRRNVLLSAARQAGLGANLVLVPEPVAAAAHFASFPGQALAAGQALAVYDLGAGTFDVAVVGASGSGFTVLAEAGLPDLGGLDVDQALLAHVGRQVSHRDPHGWQRLMRPVSTADRRAQRTLREDVRAAKEALSGHPQTDLPLPEPFEDVLVTRAELEALIRPNLLRSTELLAATVRSAGLPPGGLAGIYLVGGSSRIPLVAALIAEQLRIMPTNLDQPETAVALGAHHVPREGMSPRTENLPPAVAGADDRTTSITPPPRPPAPPTRPTRPVGPVGPTRPPTPAWAAPRYSTGFAPRPAPATANRRKVPLWAILVPAVVVLLVAALGVWRIVYLLSVDEDALHTKQIPQAGVVCDVFVDDDVRSALGVDLVLEGGGSVTGPPYGDPQELCAWKSADATEQPARATITVGRWAPRGSTEAGTEFDNNPVSTEETGSGCVVGVQYQPDAGLSADVDLAGGGDACSAARALLGSTFDNLPDA